MTYGRNGAPKLFSDEQMRQFVADGYVVFKPDLPDVLHKTIRDRLQFMVDEEFNYGNNVLPRVPEMDWVLNSPEIRGALISVLGPGYIAHPHRFCHYIAPGQNQRTLAQNCHQDSYTPLGRPRHHYPRYARVMYYPQDTPIEMGPTHLIPGTQYHKHLSDKDRQNAIPMAAGAGTVSITHFDVGHAAGIHTVQQSRHMIKFIYVRAEEPTEPSWDCRNEIWRDPETFGAPYKLSLCWSHIWDWLCGKADRYASFRADNSAIEFAPEMLDGLNSDDLNRSIASLGLIAAIGKAGKETNLKVIDVLNADPQWTRAEAIYTLGAMGKVAVKPLVEALKISGNTNEGDPVPIPWNEGAVSMDDAAHALAAIGSPALSSLIALLSDKCEWVRINAAFALGEMDSDAVSAVPALTRCLNDDSHCVVRTATDALSSIRREGERFMRSLGRLLHDGRDEWKIPDRREWTPYDQVRVNAAMAFTRLGNDAASVEALLLDTLADPNGHVAAFALEALRRIGTPSAVDGVMEYLIARRWDESIRKGRLF